jgi:hypothetical protein
LRIAGALRITRNNGGWSDHYTLDAIENGNYGCN